MPLTNLPSIPTPEYTQSGSVPAAPGNTSGLSDLYSQLAGAAAPLPEPYISGTVQAQPQLPPAPTFQPANTNNKPMTNQATSVIAARRKNAFAELGNLIGGAAQKFNQYKQDALKTKLVDVMQAKQNVENATTVLNKPDSDFASPQAAKTAKAQAQAVIVANKKRGDAILNDPKYAKQLAKALDISYVDPAKNKTPEVQTGIAAMKEVEAAGVYNASNPQEAEMAKIAAMPSGTQAPAVTRQTRMDAALHKDLPQLQPNPAYDAALKAREKQEQDVTQYIAPAILRDQAAIEEKRIAEEEQGKKNQSAENIAAAKIESENRNADLKLAQEQLIAENRDRTLRANAATAAAAKVHAASVAHDAPALAKAATDSYNQTIGAIKALQISTDKAKAGMAAMAKAKTIKSNPAVYQAYQKTVDQNATDIQNYKTDATRYQLQMTNNPQATAVDNLMGGNKVQQQSLGY